jgi:hypothetical protein
MFTLEHRNVKKLPESISKMLLQHKVICSMNQQFYLKIRQKKWQTILWMFAAKRLKVQIYLLRGKFS